MTPTRAHTGVHEILFVWCAAMAFWHVIFAKLIPTVTNVEYLQWGGVAATVVCLTRFLLKRTGFKFEAFLGSPLSATDSAELTIVLIFSVILGVGCWAGLILVEANIDARWTFAFWHLITPTEFSNVRWIPQWVAVQLLAGSILVPITEEIVFRGFILSRLRKKHSLKRAIFLTSFIFAMFHLDKSFVGSFAHGIIFAVLAIRFSSLYAPMLVHGLYNAAVSLLDMNLGTFLAKEPAQINSISYWGIELCCLVAGILFLILYMRNAAHPIRQTID